MNSNINKEEFLEEIKKLEKSYGFNFEERIKDADTVIFDGEKVDMVIVGNDECYDMNEFYHFGITNDKIYKLYYKTEDENGIPIELENINYSNPFNVEDVTSNIINNNINENKEYYIREYLPLTEDYTPWSSPEGFAKLFDSKTFPFQNEGFDFSFAPDKIQIVEFTNNKITNQWGGKQVLDNQDEIKTLLNNAFNKEKYLSFSDEEIQKAKEEYIDFEYECLLYNEEAIEKGQDSYWYPSYQDFIAERFQENYTFYVEHERYICLDHSEKSEYPKELEYMKGFAPYNYSKEFAGVPQIYISNTEDLDMNIVFTLKDGKKADDLDFIRASNVDMNDYKISHIMLGGAPYEATTDNGNTYKLNKGDVIFTSNDYGLHHAIYVIDNNLESQSSYFMTENILGNENNRKALSKYFDEYDMRSTSDLIHRTFLSYEPVIRCYEDKDTLDFLYEGVKRYNDILDSEDNRERLQEPVTERYEELSRLIEVHPEFKDAEIVKLPFPEELKEEPEKEEQKESLSLIKQLSKLKEKMEKPKKQPQKDEKSKNKHNEMEI